MNPRWPALLLLLGCAGGDTDADLDGVVATLPEVPSAELPFRMGSSGQRGTGYTANGLTGMPIPRSLLAVTATESFTWVVFPPEGRDGLDIAWAGYGHPWVRTPLLDTDRDAIVDLHMAAAPEGRVAVVTRGPDLGAPPEIRLQLVDPDEGVVLDRIVPQAPFFGESFRAFPSTSTDLAVFPWSTGDIDVIYQRRWTLDGLPWTDVRRNRWDAARGAFRGEEVLLSEPADGLEGEELTRTGYRVDIAGEMTLEPLPGVGTPDEGYALLVRRRLTRSSAEDSNDDGYQVLRVTDRRPWAQAMFVPAVQDPQWGINRNTPAPGAPNPLFDVAVDGQGTVYAGPWWEGFAMNEPGGYQRYGLRMHPWPSNPRFDSFVKEGTEAQEFTGGWYWQDGCGEVRLISGTSPRWPLIGGQLPVRWWRERADLVGDDPDASVTCPWDDRRAALVRRPVVGGFSTEWAEVASGPRAAHVAVCSGLRPAICSGVGEEPTAGVLPEGIPRLAQVDPADGAEVDAAAVTAVTVTLDPADAPVGTLCVHDATAPGGQCMRTADLGTATLELPAGWLQPGRTYRVSATAGWPASGPFGHGAAVFAPPGTPVPVATFRTAP